MRVCVTAWIGLSGICLLSTVSEAFFAATPPEAGIRKQQRISLDESATPIDNHSIPANAFSALDLAPFLNHLKRYACTKRGEQSILALIPTERREGRIPSVFGSNRLSQRKQRFVATRRSTAEKSSSLHQALPVATSPAEAIQEYILIGEAMDILQCQND